MSLRRLAAVLGLASDATIQECIKAGQNFGVQIAVDLLGCPDPLARARSVAAGTMERVRNAMKISYK